MHNRLTFLLITGLAALLFCSSSIAGKRLYKWKADDGSTYYSDAVPPEEARKSLVIMDSNGNRIRTISRAKSSEEYRQADIRKKALLVRKRAAARKQRADRDMQRMYPNEESITRIRDEKITSIDNGISLSDDALTLYKNNIASLRKRAAEYARAQKRAPYKIKRKIAEYRKLVLEMEHNIKIHRNKQEQTRQKYEKILTRYREIK